MVDMFIFDEAKGGAGSRPEKARLAYLGIFRKSVPQNAQSVERSLEDRHVEIVRGSSIPLAQKCWVRLGVLRPRSSCGGIAFQNTVWFVCVVIEPVGGRAVCCK